VRPVIALCEEVREGRHAHFHLHRPRDRAIFTSPKLVGPRQTEAPAYAYVPGDYYVDLACEVMTLPEPAPDAEEQLLALLALLNSGPSYFWLYHRGGRKGELLQLDKGPLDGVPVPAWNPELRAALATHARQLGVLATLLRDGPDLAVRVGDPPRDATLRSLLHGPWCDALLRRERGDLSASGVPRANWLAGTLRLAVGAGEVEARFIDPVFARWAQLAIEATLRAAPCKIKGVSALLDAPLATAAGGSVRREQAASWLATLDAHARSLGVPALDRPALEREIAVRDGEVDTLVADALGISDVPVDLLRRPGDAY
jgi:hypothetical protein